MITIERVEEGSCNSCTAKNVPSREIFIGKVHKGKITTTFGTQITLCDTCFAELYKRVKGEIEP